MRKTYPPFNPAALPAYQANPMGYYQNRMQQKGLPYLGTPGQPIQYRQGAGLPQAQQQMPAPQQSPRPQQQAQQPMPQQQVMQQQQQQMGIPWIQQLLQQPMPAQIPMGLPRSPYEQQGNALQGSMFGARPAPQNAAVFSGAYESAGDMRTGPQLGTEGMGLPMSEASQMQALNQQIAQEQAAERQRYVQFMNAAQQAGEGYAGYWNPETQQNEKPNRGKAAAAITANAPRHKALSEKNRVSNRAANYGRSNGLPQSAAIAGIQGMDALAQDPSYQPTEIQRYGMGLPQPQPDPMEIARIQSMGLALQGMGTGGPITPETLQALQGLFQTQGNGLPQMQDPTGGQQLFTRQEGQLQATPNYTSRAPGPIASAVQQNIEEAPWYSKPGRAIGSMVAAPVLYGTVNEPDVVDQLEPTIKRLEELSRAGNQQAARLLQELIQRYNLQLQE